MLMKQIFVTVMLFCSTSVLSAQNFQAAVNFLLGQPQDEFQEKVEDLGFGVGGMFAYRLGNGPLMI
ncbi:MAG: hypothetical protein ACE5HI_10685, partial [bacterium]